MSERQVPWSADEDWRTDLPSGAQDQARRRRRTRAGHNLTTASGLAEAIGYLRSHQISLTYDPGPGTLRAGNCPAATTTIG